MVTDFDTKVMKTVIKYVCILFNTTEDELISAKRLRHMTDGRAVCLAVMVCFTRMTEKKIAARFNRDHSTAIASVKKVMNLRDTDSVFRDKLKVIIDYINDDCKASFTIEDIVERKDTMPEDKELFDLTCTYEKKLALLHSDYNDQFTLLLAKELRAINAQIEERLNYIQTHTNTN